MSFEEVVVESGSVRVKAAPARGAIVTSMIVGGREVFYLDRESFADETKNVRGGIPVLFPYAGKLIDEIFVHAGTTMKQHGFGRNAVWKTSRRGNGVLGMCLESNGGTKATYPYDFRAEQTLTILPQGLLVELLIENRDHRAMPVSPGWHPYFVCPAAEKANVRGDVPGLEPGRMNDEREFDFGLAAPADGRARFLVPGLGRLEISFSPEMRHMQFWSQPGKPFVCLEPFFGPNNTVNSDRRLDIQPGRAVSLWMRIELAPTR